MATKETNGAVTWKQFGVVVSILMLVLSAILAFNFTADAGKVSIREYDTAMGDLKSTLVKIESSQRQTETSIAEIQTAVKYLEEKARNK